MSRSFYDGIKRAPIDRVASNVTSIGTHFEQNFIRDSRDQREPYPIRPVPPSPTSKMTSALIGMRYGRMQVIGLSRDVLNRWVVRCACGVYTLRRFAAIRNPENNNDCCSECHYIAKKTLKQASTATGKKLEISDLPNFKRQGELVQAPNAINQAALAAESYRTLPKSAKQLLRMTKEQRARLCEENRLKNIEAEQVRKQKTEEAEREKAEKEAAHNGRYSLGSVLAAAIRKP